MLYDKINPGSDTMGKNKDLFLLGVLVIVLTFVLGINIYEDYKEKNAINIKEYPFSSYDLFIDGFSFVGEEEGNNSIYLLYKGTENYLLKEISMQNNESTKTFKTSDECNLERNDNDVYIVCKNENYLKVYDLNINEVIKGQMTSNYNYVQNQKNKYHVYQSNNDKYPVVLNSACQDFCYLLRSDEIINKVAIYKENVLKESNISNYGIYENGIFTWNTKNIKIYDPDLDGIKEFKIPNKALESNIVTLSSNNYYFYYLNNTNIIIYNLYKEEEISSISIKKIDEKINKIKLNGNYLYVFTSNKLYIYDVSKIEKNEEENALYYENNLIDKKINYFKENYNVNIFAYENPSNLNSNYYITKVTNYNDLINALNYIEDYFIFFNKEFFSRFYEYNMTGLNIYFAENIKGITNGYNNANVVGVSFKKNNDYVIVLSLNSGENVANILAHETMHIIDSYLNLKNASFNYWNDYNPSGFVYSYTYYPNEIYKDTLVANKEYENNIYFVDNYARSSAEEDRARLFEYVCKGEDFYNYPHLYEKMKYLKSVLLSNFPELKSVNIFQS